jgi:hypothetical protein
MQVKPADFKGFKLVLQRETMAPLPSMPSLPNDRGSAPAAPASADPAGPAPAPAGPASATAPREIGGREGPEPTRFGDWEKGGRCIDF